MMTIVVTGATGNVGRPLVTELMRAGAVVRAVSREPAAAGLPAGVQVVSSAAAALAGASAVFVNSRALDGELADFIARARATPSVAKLVALSAINADDAFSRQPSRFRGDRNREAEQLVAGSGLPWVSLRPSIFATNFAGMWAGQIRQGDVVAGPFADATSAPIAECDIAAVAARALLDADLDGQRVPVTGPDSLTNAELVGVIAAELDRQLSYRETPPELVRARFLAIGFGAEFADAYIAMQAHTLDHPAVVTNDVEKIVGRPPQSFAQWVSEHAELFA
jgi:uncharacterized protein YbjT (DUF2867 family)